MAPHCSSSAPDIGCREIGNHLLRILAIKITLKSVSRVSIAFPDTTGRLSHDIS
jgi:hypothetical protein